MRRAPKNHGKQPPPLTLDDLPLDTKRLTNEQVRERLAQPSQNLAEWTKRVNDSLTPKERELTERWLGKQRPEAEQPPKASGLAGPLGRIFGTAGRVIGSVVDVTADAFSRLNADLGRTLHQRDEARADAVAMLRVYESGGLPSLELRGRIMSYVTAAEIAGGVTPTKGAKSGKR